MISNSRQPEAILQIKKIASLFLALLLLSSPVFAADIYINQAGTVGDTGVDEANAHSAAWFNANATGGNTYHLCGTFTGTAGSTMLTVPTGSEGNILTVLFEDDAVLTAPYWGGASHGAIDIISKSYIKIDGGTNGLIKNTANGTALANLQTSLGIYVYSSSNIEICNLYIDDIYQNGGADPDASDIAGQSTADIKLYGDNSNVSIHDCDLRASRTGISVDFSSADVSNISIYDNYIAEHCWHISLAAGNGGETTENIRIYSNEITDWADWVCPGGSTAGYCKSGIDNYHTDGIIAYQPSHNTDSLSPLIYNNYFHGSLGGGSPTAFIFTTYGGGTKAITIGGSAVDVGGGVVGIPCVGHGYVAGEWLSLTSTVNYNGEYIVQEGTTTNQINILATYAAETFASGDTVVGVMGSSPKIYNNLIIMDGGMDSYRNWGICAAGSNAEIYSNTIISKSNLKGDCFMLNGVLTTLENNICSTAKSGVSSYSLSFSDNGHTIDKNLYYNINSGTSSTMFHQNESYPQSEDLFTWAEWQAMGFDLNSYYENPNLTASYHLQSTSGNAIDHGATLDAAYNTDKDGNARPSGAAWDIGAYEYRVVPNISNFGTGAITITPNNAGAIAVTPY